MFETPTPNLETQNELAEKIAVVETFAELFTLLNDVGVLEGSSGQEYTSEELIAIISQVRDAGEDIHRITRTAGLREKVSALIANIEARTTFETVTTPHVGDRITLTKVNIEPGSTSMISVGQKIDGVLVSEICVGEPVCFGKGNTTPVVSIRAEHGKLLVETSTSTYQIEKGV